MPYTLFTTFSRSVVLGYSAFVWEESSEMALLRADHEDPAFLLIFATVDEAMLLTNDSTLLSWKEDLEARTSSI
jgi:hypothetical protein